MLNDMDPRTVLDEGWRRLLSLAAEKEAHEKEEPGCILSLHCARVIRDPLGGGSLTERVS